MESIHRNLKKHQCGTCEKRFNQSWNLKSHIERMHEKIRYKCNLCDRRFSNVENMKKHKENIHERIRNYKCDECQKDFYYWKCFEYHVTKVHKV